MVYRNIKKKIIKWLITHPKTAMSIVIEYRNEMAKMYEEM